MADNTTQNATDVIATDDITTMNGATVAANSQKAQRVKVGFGDDGIFRDASAAFPLPVYQPNALPAGTNALGTVAINAAIPTGANTIGSVGLVAGSAAIGTVAMAALTKGTQGANGVTTQDLKDAGRARVSIVFQGTAPATADTLLSLVKSSNGVAVAGATSIGVTAAKTLRITAITFSLKLNAAAAGFATMTLRSNPSGATVIGSQSELRLDLGGAAATIGAADSVTVAIPDGMEFSGAQTIGISLSASATTNIMSISINAFEY